MPQYWTKKSDAELRDRVFAALEDNVNYQDHDVFGVPGSWLDEKVFYRDASFLKDAAFLSTLLENPNHIGCHTLETSEPFFAGTQAIERELIDLCAVDILGSGPGQHDGYVASGGTEANIQALWIYRNELQSLYGAQSHQICLLCSSDSHYSVDKAANLLSLDVRRIAVDDRTRELDTEGVEAAVAEALADGREYFIVVANMMTTMFGSVDDVDRYAAVLARAGVEFRVHVDAAFGGFYYPFTDPDRSLDFTNRNVSSITLDAHKILQAPYGTGIFLARKGLIGHARTESARYVEGQDSTLIGSRSGANAVAVWMILMKYGPHGWREKVFVLQKRTDWLCTALDRVGVAYFRHPHSNIVALEAQAVAPELAADYWLVPDDHREPSWYKIVVMDHVTIDKLERFVAALAH